MKKVTYYLVVMVGFWATVCCLCRSEITNMKPLIRTKIPPLFSLRTRILLLKNITINFCPI